MRDAFQERDSAKHSVAVLEEKLSEFQERHTSVIQELNHVRLDNVKRESRIGELTQEKGRLVAVVKKFTKSQGRAAVNYTLDPFNNRLDQISEAQVKSDGQPSVDGLNDTVDTIVMELIDQAAAMVNTDGQSTAEIDGVPEAPSGLFLALARPELDADSHGLLLDALLHAKIIDTLHNQFFEGEIAPEIDLKSKFLEDVFNMVYKTGTL